MKRNDNNIDIGAHLKDIRKERKYTLNEVSHETGMSVSLLSQIENDKASPSLNSLQILLRYYRIGLSAFFDQVEKMNYLIKRKKDSETFVDKTGKIKLVFLASKLQNTKMVYYRAELYPKSKLVIAQLSEDLQGERFIYVESGSIEVIFDEAEHVSLGKEDSLLFRSMLKCIIKNQTSRTARILVSGTPPLI